MTDMKNENLSAALAAWRREIGDAQVLADVATLDRYAQNASGLDRAIGAVVKPASTDEVQRVVRIANEFHIPLYPISSGKNWGLGSRLPVTDGCVVVDLSRMNRIREVKAGQACVVVEPGVTQGQLYDYLAQNKLPFIFNVTGSGTGTSLIGNALDRGVGYFASRAENLSGLEVVLGNGQVLNTGFGHYSEAINTHVYRHGVGPSLDGLFFQSNFGIVTAAGMDLIPRAECSMAVVATIAGEESFQAFVDAWAALILQGVVRTAVHIANRNRTEISMGPLVYKYLAERGAKPGVDLRKQAIDLICAEGFGAWSAVAGIFGSREQLALARKEIRRALCGVARVQFVTDGLIEIGKKVAGMLAWIPWFARKKALVHAIEPLYGLAKGIPSSEAVYSVSWPVGEAPSPGYDPDGGRAGLLYALPMIPLDSACAQQMRDVTVRVFGSFGFEPYITVNAVGTKALECVINLAFERDKPDRVRAARECIEQLQQAFIEQGMIPYRVGIQSMGQVVRESDPFWQTVKDLKKALDPNGIIAPGRYGLISS